MKRSARLPISTDPALWCVQRKFGTAGGPDEIVLTEEGKLRAFAVGTQIGDAKAAMALELLWSTGGEGTLSICGGARHRVTGLGRFDQIVWGYLRDRGYVESFPPVHGVHGDGVRLTAAGRDAAREGFVERERLLARCCAAAVDLNGRPT